MREVYQGLQEDELVNDEWWNRRGKRRQVMARKENFKIYDLAGKAVLTDEMWLFKLGN